MKKLFLTIFGVLLVCAPAAFSQTQGSMYLAGDINSWSTTANPMTYRGLGTANWIVTIQATASNSSAGFKFENNSYTNQWSSNSTVSLNTLTSWWWNSGNSVYDQVSGDYYTFTVEDVAANSNSQGYLMETAAAPVSITSVSQSPSSSIGSSQSVVVTVKTSASPSSGENAFVRYSTDGWSTSSLAQVSFSGSTGTATIPAQTNGTSVSYYVFTTTLTSGELSSGNIDLATINYSNNGGSNYTYTVNDISLAVQMSSYSAAYNAEGVTLDWRTQSEVDNAGFNILRKSSTDAGYSKIASYKTDSALKGLGTSTSGRSYSYTDASVASGVSYDYKIQEVSTSGSSKDFGPIAVQAASTVPSRYALKQNYPNPFNPTTTISVDVRKSGYARLEIFNSLGQKVATLLDGNIQAGVRRFDWNASGFASGVYFYRFSTAGFTAVHKMMLMK